MRQRRPRETMIEEPCLRAARACVPLLAAAALSLACGDPRPAAFAPANPCALCHGSQANPAPPRSVAGAVATTAVEVGAHQLHLRDTPIRQAIACSECHHVPASVGDPLHARGTHATLTWGALATHDGAATPAWDRATATCSGVYCHGATLRAPPATGPTWTFAAEPPLSPPSAAVCGACHGWPPPSPHPQQSSCYGCHPGTVRPDGTIDVAGGLHVNGRIDGGGGGACGDCHDVPPTSGAHLAHYGDTSKPPLAAYGDLKVLADYRPAGAGYYMFGCGNCHPIDPSKHMDGVVEVELADAAAPAGSLKARAALGATYAGGTCSGVYCHSSGQEAPAYATTPAWTSGATLGCSGCHDNPPRYPSGGAGTATANSHLVLADDGWELGHFAGLPGPWHVSYHGAWIAGRDAAPITCQACHYETADPAATGPSGFYWLDTTGNYRLDVAGADASRLTTAAWLNTQCATCHAPGGAAPAGQGRVLPLRHVNGTRDVVFDPRTAIGSLPGYPGAPAAPATAPYWAVLSDGSVFSAAPGSATYDPATKTCSNAACHLKQTAVRWGLVPVGITSCDYCHQQSGVPPPP
jgi:predicted CxxxxCH...CXXCH cytochrome family protein